MSSQIEKMTSIASGNQNQLLLFTTGGENPIKPWEKVEADSHNGNDPQPIGRIALKEQIIQPTVE